MPDFNFSLLVSSEGGDSTAADVGKVVNSVDSLGEGLKKVTNPAREVGTATAEASVGATALATAVNKIIEATNPASGSAKALAAAVREAKQAYAEGAISADGFAKAQEIAVRRAKEASKVNKDFVDTSERQRYAVRNAGQQFVDFGTQVGTGQNAAIAFSQQAGQLGYALSEMQGKLGAVGKFLTGPWGVALTLAAVIITPLISKLLDSSDASEKLAEATKKHEEAVKSLIDAEKASVLSQADVLRQKFITLETERQVTLAIVNQTKAKLENAKADAEILARSPSYQQTEGGGRSAQGTAAQDRVRELQGQLDKLAPTLKELTTTAGIAAGNYLKQRVDDVSTPEKAITARYTKLLNKLIANTPDDPTKAGATAAAIQKLTSQRDAEIKAIKDSESASKKHTDQIGRSVSIGEATGIINGIGGTVTSGVRSYAKQAELYAKYQAGTGPLAAKPGTSNHELGLALDVRKSAGISLATIKAAFGEKGVRITELLDEGDHFHVAWARSAADTKALSDANKANALATREAAQAQQELDQDLQSTISQLDPARRAAENYAETLDRIARLQGAGKITVGQAFQYTQQASAAEIERGQKETDATAKAFYGKEGIDPFKDLGRIVDESAQHFSAQIGTAGFDFRDAVRDAAGNVASAIGQVFGNKAGGLAGSALDLLSGKPMLDTEKLSKSVEALAKNGGIGPDAAKKIGEKAAQGLEGAAVGGKINEFLAPIGKALGFKTSKLGAQVGGAVGSFLPIPFGKEIGAVVGSVIGGLFKKTPSGSAVITNTKDAPVTSGKLGAVVSADASQVQDSLKSIASALGGSLGSFAVSIGKREDYYRVSASGGNAGLKNDPIGGDWVYNGKDEQAAINAALANAIADGAITGISAAMKKALQSSSDVNAAVAEALKVDEVETLIGGIGATLAKQFKTFDQQAAERVRIATQYGFDVNKIEQINADQRKDLIAATLKQAAGSLQDLLDNLKFGDLSEGDAYQKRSAIQDQIAAVQGDAEAGKAGAADQLSTLLRSLVTTSKDAFGTAGPEYAADRAAAQLESQRVIDLETARITAAAAEQKAVSDKTIALANEGNDLAAQGNSYLADIAAYFSANGNGSSVVPQAASAYRQSIL